MEAQRESEKQLYLIQDELTYLILGISFLC